MVSLLISFLYKNYTLILKIKFKRAAWHGTRIILRQVSPESSPIFDFIMELYRVCDGGDWKKLASKAKVSIKELRQFLEYAATFLGNIGNYYVCFWFILSFIPANIRLFGWFIYSNWKAQISLHIHCHAHLFLIGPRRPKNRP